MGQYRTTRPISPVITPIDAKGVVRKQVPYFIHIEPPGQVPAGTTITVPYVIGPRDFVWTHIGWTSEGVAFPSGAGMPFKINIQDVGFSQFFAPFRFLARPVTGNNPNTSDNAAFELPHAEGEEPWRFGANTTLSVEFENIGAMACIPYLILVGYLD